MFRKKQTPAPRQLKSVLRNAEGHIYEQHEQDPDALLKVCPVCNAPIGSWCGGIFDVHSERV